MSVPPQVLKIRRYVWTGAIAAVTMTGAWYGAGLKTKQEIKQVSQQRLQATPEEKIAQLQEQRGALIAKRIGLERKIQELDARKKGKSREESRVGMERR